MDLQIGGGPTCTNRISTPSERSRYGQEWRRYAEGTPKPVGLSFIANRVFKERTHRARLRMPVTSGLVEVRQTSCPTDGDRSASHKGLREWSKWSESGGSSSVR